MTRSGEHDENGFWRACCCGAHTPGQADAGPADAAPASPGAEWSRRRFLETLVAALGTAAVGGLELAEAAAPVDAAQALKQLIVEHARAADDPWLLLHGIRALGRSFTVDGDPAFEYLCRKYLAAQSVSGQSYVAMPTEVQGGHTNAFLSEAVLDAGIPTGQRFEWNGRRYTVGDLVTGAKALFRFDPASFDRDDLAWSLVVFAHTVSPGHATWVNAYGESIRFAEVVEFGTATLEGASAQLLTTMRQGAMPTAKDRIHDFTCGGTHLIYGLVSCLRFGHAPGKIRQRLQTQFDLLLWRLQADPYLIDRFYQQAVAKSAAKQETAEIYLWDARLKFLGHALEVATYARLFGLLDVPSAQARRLTDARRELTDTVGAIARAGVGRFAGNKRLYKLLLGDACHAYHGLQMAKGVNQT